MSQPEDNFLAKEILGIDVGQRRLGLARIDRRVGLSQPLTILTVDGREWLQLKEIIKKNESQLLVVGQPGQWPEDWYKTWCQRLKKEVDLPIVFHDERLTTVSARQRLKDQGGRAGDRVDHQAAAIILEDYLGMV